MTHITNYINRCRQMHQISLKLFCIETSCRDNEHATYAYISIAATRLDAFILLLLNSNECFDNFFLKFMTVVDELIVLRIMLHASLLPTATLELP